MGRPSSGASLASLNNFSIDAASPYRGKWIRFDAEVRVEPEGDGAAMWLRVDRLGGRGKGLFDNMYDRPITSSKYGRYGIIGRVDEDAQRIHFGFLIHPPATRAYFANPRLEILAEDDPAVLAAKAAASGASISP